MLRPLPLSKARLEALTGLRWIAALLVFLTSLDDPVIAEGFLRGIDLIRRQHIVCVGMIRPPGARPMFQNTALPGVRMPVMFLRWAVGWMYCPRLTCVL